VQRLAIGFNHNVQIELVIEDSIRSMRRLRARIKDNHTRIILSHLEGILSQYEPISFDSIVPKENSPRGLISMFDRLLNDPEYTAFSASIGELTEAKTRQKALIEVREFARRVCSTTLIGTSWDYVTKILKVWPGIPLPESKDFAAIVKDRRIPGIMDLAEARARAAENWRSYATTNPPLSRDGAPLSGDNVDWLPPMPSMKAGQPSSQYLTLGTVGELRQLLMEFEKASSGKTRLD
jgi:hypothetical protein